MIPPAALAASATFEQVRSMASGTDGRELWIALAVAGFALSIVPAILALVTSFTRILIVLGFLRQALGIGDVPPDRILAALAFFLTLFTMAPVTNEIAEKAVGPWMAGKTGASEALTAAAAPLKRFMAHQTRPADLLLFSAMARTARPRTPEDVPFAALVPAFVISELKTAFQIGIAVFLPFLAIDLIVATTISSLGLAGLNPITLAVPFKLLLFVLADGWHLVAASLVKSIQF